MRNFMAFIAGSTFGTGLLISGMTDTTKVQGWLDIFGAWDPTLAFVMSGAIIPMAIAWRLAAGRTPLLGGLFPPRPEPRLGRNLIIGSTLFGVGWGLAGLCPGPSIAALGFSGIGGITFVVSMLLGMWLAPFIRAQIDQLSPVSA